MSKGFVYILECSDGSYYTGSTVDLELRIEQHQNGLGANHTKTRLPVKLLYFETFTSISEAFNREKQIQGWSRKKKEALINKNFKELPKLSDCKNDSHHSNVVSTPLNHQEPVSVAEQGSLSGVEVSRSYYSNGKLLLTGEYVVLDGAIALAVPTKQGQSLHIEAINEPLIYWESIDKNGNTWYKGSFELHNKILKQVQHDDVSVRLIQIFKAINKLNPDFFSLKNGYKIITRTGFPRNWGLGTSSTLINNIAQWANVDAYKLLELTFGGSGYDIACAQNNTPITYQIEGKSPQVKPVEFNPSFKEQLYFVHLNKKQNSREGIAHYRAQNKEHIKDVISEVNSITSELITCKSLENFEALINKHESIIAKVTNQTPVKELLFNDFKGCMKSLGAWGGDFVLVASKANPVDYFENKGYTTVIPYANMIL